MSSKSFAHMFIVATEQHCRREVLGLPLLDHIPPDSYELLQGGHIANEQPRSEHHVLLEARRGRGGRGGSRPSRPKPTRKKKSTKTKKKTPKPSSKKPPKSTSKSTKNVWPTPAVSRPTTAIDPCYLFIDCSSDESALKDIGAGRVAKRAGNYPIDMHITESPLPTETATIDHYEKRDVRTQKPKMGTSGTLVIKNLDYPGSGKLFSGSSPARHAFQFNDNSIKDARVKDLRRAPAKTIDFATEHIVELQTLGKFLESVAKKNSALAKFLLNTWNTKLSAKQIKARTNKPSYGLTKLPQSSGNTLNDLVFNAFGSNTQLEDFVLCDDKINSYKARVWSGKAPMSASNFKTLLKKSLNGKLPSNEYLTALKMVFGVFDYMDQTVVTTNMRRVIANVGKELANVKPMFDKANLSANVPAGSVFPAGADLQKDWSAYMKSHLTTISTKAQTWANTQITHALAELKKEIFVLEQTMKKLQALEKKATPAYKKNKQAAVKRLTTQIVKHKREVAAIAKKIVLLEKQRKATPSSALTKQIKAQKKAWQKKVEAQAGAERQRAMLYSTSVKKIIAGLKQDEIILKAYKGQVKSDLVMPTP
ncbi:Killer toxin subunits alpha/beta 4 [Paraphaeosphaeria minitans]|uniref:Killer toxin subunits alpha/beta 4 n=1 Tax=Paraphaeosphaeria minitans TaxID=565426 RepID=A0A9P6GF60_9PLEO|nr:Killer toxin subunits alpha/beta 4 [Paraphaeosphaeria minitans]